MKKHSGEIQQRTFEFACEIARFHRAVSEKNSTSRILGGQLLKSATSIGANLEEASAGQSKADFIAKCRIALKEARETKCWLRLIGACEPISKTQIDALAAESAEIIAILTAIVKKASSSPLRG